jgi:hypothetical protein
MVSQITFKVIEKDTTTNVRVTMDSYNKPLNIEKPEGAKSLLEIMSGLYTQSLGGEGAEEMLQLPTSLSL